MTNKNSNIVELTASVVSAYVANNRVQASELGGLVTATYSTFAKLGSAPEPELALPLVPAVSVRKSVTADAIICLEDGKAFKSLKRHLNTAYGLTPDEYRRKWNLPPDYPMVAPAYAAARSALAKAMGLGRKRQQEIPVAKKAKSGGQGNSPRGKKSA